MTEYNPDCWVVFRVNNPDLEKPCYKVFGGWYGGYLNGDSWKINSGIVRVEKDENLFKFYGESGSVYIVHNNSYKMSGYMSGVWANMMNKIPDSDKMFEIMSEDTDWMLLEYV